MLIKTFMTHVLQFFILRLRLRSTTEGRSFSGPNIWLRLKVKIKPTVQHCFLHRFPGLKFIPYSSIPESFWTSVIFMHHKFWLVGIYFKVSCFRNVYGIPLNRKLNTVFPWIMSSLEYYPPFSQNIVIISTSNLKTFK